MTLSDSANIMRLVQPGIISQPHFNLQVFRRHWSHRFIRKHVGAQLDLFMMPIKLYKVVYAQTCEAVISTVL